MSKKAIHSFKILSVIFLIVFTVVAIYFVTTHPSEIQLEQIEDFKNYLINR